MSQFDIKWVKSSYSGGSGTECVEAASIGLSTAVRDSKKPHGPHLTLAEPAWTDFVAAIGCGKLS
ncbi:DUF397 domain-containing protein [Streptomyces sp. CAU 1734]|uniref:DUF397 domain-containing protein n=1 Tax=Streptomyces sp. CAU 1734 TaxID=3140360 RepID=UPI0032607AC6